MRILVVDDDPLGSRMVQFLLAEQGYAVDMTDSARGALMLLDERTPDLILLDVNLPHLNGFDFCKRLRNDGYEMPVIFVTAKGDLEDRLEGLKIGADDYICKPFQPAELTARVEAVLRRYRRTRGDGVTIQTHSIEIDAIALRVNLPGQTFGLPDADRDEGTRSSGAAHWRDGRARRCDGERLGRCLCR